MVGRDTRWYLLISAGEFIGSFIVFSSPNRDEVEAYRDALLVKRGVRQSGPGMPLQQVWGPGIEIVSDAWLYDFWPRALRRYEAAQTLLAREERDDGG